MDCGHRPVAGGDLGPSLSGRCGRGYFSLVGGIGAATRSFAAQYFEPYPTVTLNSFQGPLVSPSPNCSDKPCGDARLRLTHADGAAARWTLKQVQGDDLFVQGDGVLVHGDGVLVQGEDGLA